MRVAVDQLSLQHDALYEALVENIPAVVYVDADDESSSTLYMSPQVEEMLGYTQEEWLEDPDLWVELLHPEDRECARAEANRTRTTGETFEAEYRLLARDDRVVWVHDKAVRVEEIGDEADIVWQGVMLDITERKRASEEFRRSEERFRRTFESAGVGMAHVTPDGRWLRINDKFCEISGYDREELLGMTFLELTPPEDRQASMDRVRRMLTGGHGPYSIERRYVRKDGSRVWVDLSVSLVRKTTGEPDFFICVAEDITKRKIAELIPDPLSCKEMEVLRLVAWWQTNREISQKLNYSESMIKSHVQNILAKLSVRDRRQAAAKAVDIGLIPPPR